ncbi:hypothetical protein Moror_15225 [Moniliophthora roreri MCA 2997]|uniref:Uncharacterized protein n=1 Tax=Moniliophthora roreri (strain MCA 2997) TaxID=1381753 RepID=V2WYR7_MONRO|nr:hypothetical protein Moror_15225 [Moniliophthora roreri MCA 2997]
MLKRRSIESESGLVQSSFAFCIIFILVALVQGVFSIIILTRRRQQASFHRLPFILILLACLTLVVDYALEVTSLIVKPDMDYIENISTPSIRLGKAAFIIHPIVQQLRDVFLLSSLLAILDRQRLLFHRDVLFTLFSSHKKRFLDIAILGGTLMVIVIVAILGAVYTPFVDDPVTFSVYMGMKHVYTVSYVVLSLNVLCTTLFLWDRMCKVEGFRDPIVNTVLLEIVCPIISVLTIFIVAVDVLSSSNGFRVPFNPQVFLLVVVIVEGLSYCGLISAVLSLHGKMLESVPRGTINVYYRASLAGMNDAAIDQAGYEQERAGRQAVREAKAALKAAKREAKQDKKKARIARRERKLERKRLKHESSASTLTDTSELKPDDSLPTYAEATSDAVQPKIIESGHDNGLSFAKCAQGDHQRKSKYGCTGIVAASCLFPVGLVWMYLDREIVCQRCGVVLKAKKIGCGQRNRQGAVLP